SCACGDLFEIDVLAAGVGGTAGGQECADQAGMPRFPEWVHRHRLPRTLGAALAASVMLAGGPARGGSKPELGPSAARHPLFPIAWVAVERLGWTRSCVHWRRSSREAPPNERPERRRS